jgi:hypothetical protein
MNSPFDSYGAASPAGVFIWTGLFMQARPWVRAGAIAIARDSFAHLSITCGT